MRSPQRLRRGAHAAPRRGRAHGASPTLRGHGRHRAPGLAAAGGWNLRAPLRVAAATALSGAAVGVALSGQPASAQSGSSVEFAGSCGVAGLGLLGGDAASSPGQLRVPAGTEVAFTNRFDRPATLHVNGDAAALVGPGDAAEVVFAQGPATVTMRIKCPVGGQAASAMVDVVAASQPAAPPSPGTSTGPAAPAGPGAGQPDQPDPGPDGGSRAPGSEQAGSAPDPSGWQAFVAPPVPGSDPGGSGPGRPGAEQPADAAAEADGDEPGARWRDQPDGGAVPADPDIVDQHASDSAVATDRLASTAGSPVEDGPIGLLALVAGICVVGVSAGAVRAIIAQRAASGVAA